MLISRIVNSGYWKSNPGDEVKLNNRGSTKPAVRDTSSCTQPEAAETLRCVSGHFKEGVLGFKMQKSHPK